MKPFLNQHSLESLCGPNNTFQVWDNSTSNFGPCFQNLALIVPTYVLLALSSAYGLGSLSVRANGERFWIQKWALIVRMGVCLVSIALPVGNLVYLMSRPQHDPSETQGYSTIIKVCVMALAWSLNFLYLFGILKRPDITHRGCRPVLMAYLFCLIASGIEIRSELLLNQRMEPSVSQTVMLACALAQVFSHIFYLITLLPPSGVDGIQYEEFGAQIEFRNNQREGLGVAKSRANWISKLFISWVSPLIYMGRRSRLKSPDNLFDVPNDITSAVANYRVQMIRASEQPGKPFGLIGILFKIYGMEFLAIGILKFLADCTGFASPIILNLIVSFMEDSSKEMFWGYLYAVGLAAATFATALCTTHQDLFMGELKLKVRASVITCIYDHTLNVSMFDMSKFNLGQVINYMSVDVDKIVNFFPSLHTLWSLPFQICVTMYLLYLQVGMSSLVGVVVSIILIPLNKIFGDLIAKYSEATMKAKDRRVKVMSEILHGIRVLKYFTWERYFREQINRHRKDELTYLKYKKYIDALCVYCWATTPILISVLTFTTYVLLGNELTAAKVFTSVALFSMLTGPINAFPCVINGLKESQVSIRRIVNYLSSKIMDPKEYFASADDLHITSNVDIFIQDGTFSTSSPGEEEGYMVEKICLHNIDMTVVKGHLVGVIGKVGSGKSTLLKAILGELKRISGRIFVRETLQGIGYVQQEPWLQNGTLRQNILCGQSFRERWYRLVVDACALTQDLNEMAAGDQTQVGEKGVMLSGGQKARLALARAVYHEKDIYLIDDIFSAVDTKVGNHIYNHCIMGLLKEKTRILCTHHLKFLNKANGVITLDDGKMCAKEPKEFNASNVLNDNETNRTEGEANEESQLESSGEYVFQVANEETRETGNLNFQIYKNYWHAVGCTLSSFTIASLIFMQATKNFSDVWLAEWVSRNRSSHLDFKTNNTDVNFYLEVYCSLGAANTFFTLIRAFLFAYGGIVAAKTIHTQLLDSILRTKSTFFDNTPAGRILNRFSSDVFTVDDSLPFELNIFLANCVSIFGPVVVVIISLPWILLVLLPLTVFYLDIQRKYRPASRDLKRIGSVSLSPLYAHFSESLSGLETIRAMKKTDKFIKDNEQVLENNQKAQYAGVVSSQWLQMRLQLIGCAIVSGIAVIGVLEHHLGSINPGFVGLAISYALGITSKLSGLIGSFTETEKELIAVERCYQYINNAAQEGSDEEDGDNPSSRQNVHLPPQGRVSFQNVNLRYRQHLPLALDNFSFETKPNEKIGIVGRTGAGKSSLFQVLFRMVSIQSGQIEVDGVSIHEKPVHHLRKQIAIIPQDPFLFCGSIRENLDPYGTSTDAEIWESLKLSHLQGVVQTLGGLDALVAERGQNFSMGQKQLFCFARAILSNAKVICIDEATANVDMETDNLIQEVISTTLADRTVLTIAHRLQTIMKSHRIIVMSKGKVIESGTPEDLLKSTHSHFSQLVTDSNRI